MITLSSIISLGQESTGLSTIDAKAWGHDDSMQIRAWLSARNSTYTGRMD